MQPAARPAGAEKILVIDDDPSVRDLMTRFVGKMGFDAFRPRMVKMDCAWRGKSGLRSSR